jgi:cysteinyl-tRNA synthetase
VTLRLYDTRTRTLRPLEPIRPGEVGVYVCGPTVQAAPHVGHLRSAVAIDVLHRWLIASGNTVTFVRNVTDVDDKIIHDAAHNDEPWWALSARMTRAFDDAYDAVQVLRPTIDPRVTGHLPQILALIERIIERGHAYVSGGDVYLSVRTVDGYGALSNQSLDALQASEKSVPHGQTGEKRDPLDFALWKSAKPGEPSWPSPWGPGRPGWHIECSAMALRYGAETLDIHGGGADLIFPHHESEIAQSESFTGIHPFVRTWVHVAMLRYQGEKMSKSLGNLVLVKDLLTTHSADAVRLSLLAVHYRDSRDWTRDALDHATERARRLQAAAEREAAPGEEAVDPAPSLHEFTAALDNDLDTPAALAALDRLADRILAPTGRDVTAARAALRSSAAELGLTLSRTRE